jgi:hypothetical protein
MKWARELGMWLEWNMLIGFPGEDPADYPPMAELIRAIPHLQPPWGCTFVRLDRFSPYFRHPREFGISDVQPLEVYSYIYPFDQTELADLVYYFRYRFADGRDPRGYTQCVVDAVDEWNRIENASLTYGPAEDSVLIQDNRPGFPRREFRLRGLEKDIFLFCDQVRSLRAICSFARGRWVERSVAAAASAGQSIIAIEEALPVANDYSVPEEVDLFLRGMVDLKLMLRENGNYLSIATERPKSGPF